MYAPVSTTFLSEDPLGLDGGDPNEHRYAGNSPTNATDPSGLYYFGTALAEDEPAKGTPDNHYNGIGSWTWQPGEDYPAAWPRPVDIHTNVPFNKAINLNKAGLFNFATWFPEDDGDGYWEYMNHRWDNPNEFMPGNCPRLEHSAKLPELDGRLTLYGVVPVTPFPKPKK